MDCRLKNSILGMSVVRNGEIDVNDASSLAKLVGDIANIVCIF